MKIAFVVRIDDTSTGTQRRFVYNAESSFPAVPQVGHFVELASDGERFRGLHRVHEIGFQLDGTVNLTVDAEGITVDPTAQIKALEAAGYAELR